ncbi:hypothetical protein ACQEVB_20525 [Pseudonocardia sp. CA-107938]|uniref:hypothetical protein n=1 Tax=Pseudonocardia sp. CA-107938 TaxID=3240021 RepID=UPI003D93F832
MRNGAASGMNETIGERGGFPEEAPRGAVRAGRRRTAGPRPVRPVAALPASRPVQPVRPANRTAPVAVVVPLFGDQAGERLLDRPAFDGPCAPRASVRESMQAAGWTRPAPADSAVRRFLSGLALLVAVVVTVVLLGLVAAMAGEARGAGAGDGGAGTTVMVSPEGGAVTR